MDERYFIFGGIALLLLALAIYLVESIARYRRAVRKSRQVGAVPDTEGEAKYLTDDDHASRVFAPAPVEATETGESPVAGVPTASERVVGLYEGLLESPDGEASPAAPATPPGSAARHIPLVEREPEEAPGIEEPSRPAHLSVETPSPTEAAELVALMSELEAIDEPRPALAPEIAPAPAPAPAPTPTPTPTPTPAPAVQPGYSLADELERLMNAAEAQSALLTPEAHERAYAASAPIDREATYEAPPLLPPLSVGQVLSAAEERPVATSQPATVPSPTGPTAPAYQLVAPVELHFTGGGGRVGVKPGTRSYAEFQRLAGIMLNDLQAARGR